MGGTYDAAEPNTRPWNDYQDYGHNHWHNSLFWGEGISDISITGPGLIWGTRFELWRWSWTSAWTAARRIWPGGRVVQPRRAQP